ncbi:MAG: substrate-binding domain-containing protein [Pirellulales bacterium]
MAKIRRVAVIIDLSWAYQHHHGVFVGTQRYAQAHGNWECTVGAYADPDMMFPGTHSRYDGIIARTSLQLAERAQAAGIPLVNVYANTSAKGLVTVSPDREAVGRWAAEHLLGRGFHHFGFLGFQREQVSKTHLEGFRAALREAGKTCTHHLAGRNFDRGEAYWQHYLRGMDDWIDTWTLPIGVFVTIDLACRYLAEACRRKRLNIPNDVGLIGTQNEKVICLQPEPMLTSIDVSYEQVGYTAAQILDDMMDGKPSPDEPVLVPPKELVPRGSTDVLMVSDPLVSQALRFMAEQGHTGIRVQDVANAVSTARRTLERRFRAAMRRPIAEELTRLKVERVKRMLVETTTPIDLLAANSGFIDGKQLGKTFTRVVGVSPREYRRRRQAK